jgi:hypothetical protein
MDEASLADNSKYSFNMSQEALQTGEEGDVLVRLTFSSNGKEASLIWTVTLLQQLPMVDVQLSPSPCRRNPAIVEQQVDCVINGGDVLAIKPILSFTGNDISVLSDVTYNYRWQELTQGLQLTSVFADIDWNTDQSLTIDTSRLQSDVVYEFELNMTLTSASSQTSSAVNVVRIRINPPPYLGSCTMGPDQAEPLAPDSFVTCTNWVDDLDAALLYSYGYELITDDNARGNNRVEWTQTSGLKNSVQGITLPEGRWRFVAIIADAYGMRVRQYPTTSSGNTSILVEQSVQDVAALKQIGVNAISQSVDELDSTLLAAAITVVLEAETAQQQQSSDEEEGTSELVVNALSNYMNQTQSSGGSPDSSLVLRNLNKVAETSSTTGSKAGPELAENGAQILATAINGLTTPSDGAAVDSDQVNEALDNVLMFQSFVLTPKSDGFGALATETCSQRQVRCARVFEARSNLAKLVSKSAENAAALGIDVEQNLSTDVLRLQAQSTQIGKSNLGQQASQSLAFGGDSNNGIQSIVVPDQEAAEDVNGADDEDESGALERSQTVLSLAIDSQELLDCFDIPPECQTDNEMPPSEMQNYTRGSNVVDLCTSSGSGDLCGSDSGSTKKELAQNVSLTFAMDPSDEQVPSCAWWDRNTSTWSSSGCTTSVVEPNGPNEKRTITCTCNHLTEFAIMQLKKLIDNIGTEQPIVNGTDPINIVNVNQLLETIESLQDVFLGGSLAYLILLATTLFMIGRFVSAHMVLEDKIKRGAKGSSSLSGRKELSGSLKDEFVTKRHPLTTMYLISCMLAGLRAIQCYLTSQSKGDTGIMEVAAINFSYTAFVFMFTKVSRAWLFLCGDVAVMCGTRTNRVVQLAKTVLFPAFYGLAIGSVAVASMSLLVSRENITLPNTLMAIATLVFGIICPVLALCMNHILLGAGAMVIQGSKNKHGSAAKRCRRVRNLAMLIGLLMCIRAGILLITGTASITYIDYYVPLTMVYIACDLLAIIAVLLLYYPTYWKTVSMASKYSADSKQERPLVEMTTSRNISKAVESPVQAGTTTIDKTVEEVDTIELVDEAVNEETSVIAEQSEIRLFSGASSDEEVTPVQIPTEPAPSASSSSKGGKKFFDVNRSMLRQATRQIDHKDKSKK